MRAEAEEGNRRQYLDGTTIDQIIANKIGQETPVPSLQLAIEDPGANSSNCGEGYSCAYTNSISWASPTQPLPMELNPQIVFEKLFGDVQAKSAEERAARREQDRSILDSVSQKLAKFSKDLPASDRNKVDEWATDIREIERRLQVAKQASGTVTDENVAVPAGIPEAFDDHVKLHFDLTTLGFKMDGTRVAARRTRWDWTRFARNAIRTSSPAAGNGSASALPARWRSNPNCSCATNP